MLKYNAAFLVLLIMLVGGAVYASSDVLEGDDALARDEAGRTGLMIAASNCDPGGVQKWLDLGADPNLRDTLQEATALIHAGYGCHISGATEYGPAELKKRAFAITQKLIAAGADVNLKNGEGDSALSVLTHRGFVESIKMALNMASQETINAQNGSGCTPLDNSSFRFTYATCDEQREIQDILLAAGAKPGNAHTCPHPYRRIRWHDCRFR